MLNPLNMKKYDKKLTELLHQYQLERPDVHTYTITTRNQRITKRPTGDKEIMDIHNNLKLKLQVTIGEFAELVQQPYGITYAPATYNGLRSNDTWEQQSLFCLDFDKNLISIDDVIKRFGTYDIIPNLYYTTFSHTEGNPRFRFCLFLDTVISNSSERESFTKSLLNLFPEADQSCKDSSRMFFGGFESLY